MQCPLNVKLESSEVILLCFLLKVVHCWAVWVKIFNLIFNPFDFPILITVIMTPAVCLVVDRFTLRIFFLLLFVYSIWIKMDYSNAKTLKRRSFPIEGAFTKLFVQSFNLNNAGGGLIIDDGFPLHTFMQIYVCCIQNINVAIWSCHINVMNHKSWYPLWQKVAVIFRSLGPKDRVPHGSIEAIRRESAPAHLLFQTGPLQ